MTITKNFLLVAIYKLRHTTRGGGTKCDAWGRGSQCSYATRNSNENNWKGFMILSLSVAKGEGRRVENVKKQCNL